MKKTMSLKIIAVIAGLLFFIAGCDRGTDKPTPPKETPKSKAPQVSVQKPTEKSSRMEKFVLVPAGSFVMGEQESVGKSRHNKPRHKVTISNPFYIGKFEVTQKEWTAVMGENPSWIKDENLPVDRVSWDDTQKFIQKLNKAQNTNYRLPTEAEWEYACRAGSDKAYCFGDDADQLGEYGWYEKNSGGQLHPVGQKKPNQWGVFDMHGNVYEWCQDVYGNYTAGSSIDPAGPATGRYCVARGGSCMHSELECRSAGRRGDKPNGQYTNHGFRLAFTPS